MKHLLVLAALCLMSNGALALQLQCNSINPSTDLRVTYDENKNTLAQERMAANEDGEDLPAMIAEDVTFTKAAPGVVALKSQGTLLMKLKVSGHPLRAQVSFLDEKNGEHTCIINGDTRPLFEALIDNPDTQAAIRKWRDWAGNRPAACDPVMDSQGYFQPGSAHLIAVVLHGYSSSPKRMEPVIQALLDNGFNVIAPRLSYHYTTNLRDLDNADYSAWEKDAEAAFGLAKNFSPHVTLAGFSLGGILASELAINHSDSINRMLLFAPAWRINSMVDLGTILAPLIKKGASLNDFYGTPIACTVNEGYVSSHGGRQIEGILTNLENKWSGNYNGVAPTAFARFEAPTWLFTTPTDEALQVNLITQICDARKIRCHNVSVPGLTHVTMIDDLNAKTSDGNTTMADVIKKALR